MYKQKIGIAQEHPDPNEELFVQNIIDVIRNSLKKDYADGKMYRRFHPKSHGLLNAEFKVQKNLPNNLRVGLFSEEITYKALVRFSNASPKASADYNKSVRGMSIKVLGVKTSTDGTIGIEATQDILLTTNKILFPGTISTYAIAMKGLFKCWLYQLLIILNPFNWRSLFTLFKASKRVSNLLETTFWSGTPYLFGEGQAVKWKAKPERKASSIMPCKPNESFLRQKLGSDLANNEYMFDLLVQLQEDPKKQPIENSSIKWDTPFIKVSTITILKQDFNSEIQNMHEEEIFFSPWNTIPEHRPLGGNNRLRKQIYTELFEFRKQWNKSK